MSVNKADFRTALLTLGSSGFAIERVDRKAGYSMFIASRLDEFGLSHKIAFVVSESGEFSAEEVRAAWLAAEYLKSYPVYIGKSAVGTKTIEWDTFMTLLGGAVVDKHPMESRFGTDLETLAFNQLPAGLKGKPDTLFEIYARNAIQFLLGVKVVRYGQDRLFEARPDGIILSRQNFNALYDAKSYSNSYPVNADSIRQFASYIREFQSRYSAQIERVNSFIVVSGAFEQGKDALQVRSADLVAECGVPLCFLTAQVLREMLSISAAKPWARSSVLWSKVFSRPVATSLSLKEEINSIAKDGVAKLSKGGV